MRELASAQVSTECGLEDDFRGRPGPRQITVLSEEQWNDACHALERPLPWTTRRANFLVKGICFPAAIGQMLRIGEEVVLEVTGETEPCGRMEEVASGLRDALAPQWRGGVTCRVVASGRVALDQPVTLTTPDSAPKRPE